MMGGNKATARTYIELALEYAERPLYNPLETGFRHRPLTVKERLERYESACAFIAQDLRSALAEIDEGNIA
jgi:hypothetical protein